MVLVQQPVVEAELFVGTPGEAERPADTPGGAELVAGRPVALAVDQQFVHFAGHPYIAAPPILWPCDGPLNRQLRPPRRLLRVVFFLTYVSSFFTLLSSFDCRFFLPGTLLRRLEIFFQRLQHVRSHKPSGHGYATCILDRFL